MNLKETEGATPTSKDCAIQQGGPGNQCEQPNSDLLNCVRDRGGWKLERRSMVKVGFLARVGLPLDLKGNTYCC